MYLSSFIQFLYLQIVAVVFGASPGSQGLATRSFLSCFVQDDPPWGPEGLPWPALIIDQHDWKIDDGRRAFLTNMNWDGYFSMLTCLIHFSMSIPDWSTLVN